MGRLLFYKQVLVGELRVELSNDEDHLAYKKRLRHRLPTSRISSAMVSSIIVQTSLIMEKQEINP